MSKQLRENLSVAERDAVATTESFWQRGPIHADFNLTNGCNLSCSHCHASSGPKLENEMQTDEILAAVADLHQMGVLSIAFAGGEPFIRRDILDILEFACSLSGWSVSVITNGLFFNRDVVVRRLKENCSDININISLDGSTPRGFSTLRKQKNAPDADPTKMFEGVLGGIEAVVGAGISNSVNFTLTRATLDDVLPTYGLVVDELGAGGMVGIKFFPGGFGRDHLRTLELPYDLWSRCLVRLTELKLAGGIPHMQISVPASWEFYLPLIENEIDVSAAEHVWGYRSPARDQYYAGRRTITDVAGVAEVCVGADGQVYPSVLFSGDARMVCGDLRQASLHAVWAESPLLNRLRDLSADDLSGDCGTCQLRTICGGGSRSRSFAATGSLLASDYLCPLVRGNPEEAAAPSGAASGQWVIPTITVDKTGQCANPLSSDNQPSPDEEIQTVGTGCRAARIYRTRDGYEIRAGGRVITARGEIARALDSVISPRQMSPTPDHLLVDANNPRRQSLLRQVENTLVEAGVPPAAINRWLRGKGAAS